MLRVYRAALGAMVGVALLAAPAAAQVTNGQIFGVVTDQSGATVPGVTVTLESSALIRPMVEVTAISGRYEFPIVPIGTYIVNFELTGFSKVVRPDVIIQTGFAAEVNAQLAVGGLTDTVEVSGAAPIVDTRKTTVGSTFTRDVMDAIPNARDPWQIINMAVGVETGAFNVGGNNSGQQLGLSARGNPGGETMWNVEGATITDMAATGASPTYYDFDSFQEIQVTTGGGDASIQTGGININMVTRSGSNVFKGTGRVVYSDKNMQNRNVTEDLFDIGAGSGTPLKYYREYGGEAGGPLKRNQAWWWFAAARQDISKGVLGFFKKEPACQSPANGGTRIDDFENLQNTQDCLHPDFTNIYNYNGKVNYQLNSSNKFQFLYTYGNKVRNARNARDDRAPESVWRQLGYGPGNFNFKHTWVATDKLVFDTLAQRQGGGFHLTFQPGTEGQQVLQNRDTGFNSRGLYTSNFSPIVRPTTEFKTDSSYFFSNMLGGDHTTKFGVRYRNTPWQTDSSWEGGAQARISTRYTADGSFGPDRARIRRPGINPTGLWTTAAYLQDNYTRGRLRLNLGVRWDFQNDEAKAGSVPANNLRPDLLPAQSFEGADRNVNYSDISPRISFTYDLLGTGKTVLNGGFAQYYGQGVGLSGALNLLGSIIVTFQNTSTRTCWDDANGDTIVDGPELHPEIPGCAQFPNSFDPATSLRETTDNEVDPNLKNNRTTEFTLGIEHELLPNFAVGVNYINRLYDRFRRNIRIGETKDMWVQRTWTNADAIAAGEDPMSDFGLPGSYIYYEFNPTLVRPPGVTRTQNIEEDHRYNGVDLTITKRFSDRWMLNMATTIQKRVQDPNFCFDCTNFDKTTGINDITQFIIKLNGMYAFPGGWNAAANLQISEGGNNGINFDGPPSGYRSQGVTATGAPRTLGGVNFTAYDTRTQLEPLRHMLDASLTKSFDLNGGQQRLNLIFTVFNVLNANTVTRFRNDLNESRFGNVRNILSPRIARVQATISF